MKYTEVVKSWDNHRSDVIAFQEECTILLSRVMSALSSELEIPADRRRDVLRFVPLSKRDDWKTSDYAPGGAIELEARGVATAGIILLLELGKGTSPKAPMLIPLEFRKPEHRLLVRTKSGSVQMSFSKEPSDEEVNEFALNLTAALSNSWTLSFARWKAGENVDVGRPIGF